MPDPYIEALEVVRDAERHLSLIEIVRYQRIVWRRGWRRWLRELDAWWMATDSETKNIIMTLFLIVVAETANRVGRR